MTVIDRGVVVLQPLAGVRARLASPGTTARSSLRAWLISIDAIAATVGWSCATLARRPDDLSGLIKALMLGVSVAAVTVACIAMQRLYLTRVCAIRAVEISRLLQSTAGAAVGAMLAPRALGVPLSLEATFLGAVLTFGLLLLGRGGFRHYLLARRRDGRFCRSVVVIGANEDGYDLFKLVQDHPELGLEVAGIVGTGVSENFPPGVRMLGSLEGAVEATIGAGATGVLVAATALAPGQINKLVRGFHRHGIHVQISSGLRGLDHRRLRQQPLAYEPLFYVEPLQFARWQFVVKRVVDIVVGSIATLLLAPLMLAAALAIKLQDRGPVFYRQERIGLHRQPFTILKFRTMIPNADKLYDSLAETKAGRDGPLIKIAGDPRRTKIGRILERFSIDELPQLLNVLKGEMSLVGPRPAQASEVERFDEELLTRQEVLPGITGLWQVEARDNPSFSAYRRYDLFYMENWSLLLDVAILVATAQRVVLRGVEAVIGRRAEMGGGVVKPAQPVSTF